MTRINLTVNALIDNLDNAGIQDLWDFFMACPPEMPIHLTGGARFNETVQLGRAMKQARPSAEIILRRYPDDRNHKRISHENWVLAHAGLAAEGFIIADTNEPGTGDLHLQDEWMSKNLNWMGQRGYKVCAFNIETHHMYTRFDWEKLPKTMKALSDYDHFLGLHRYFSKENHDAFSRQEQGLDAYYLLNKHLRRVRRRITEIGYANHLDPKLGFRDGSISVEAMIGLLKGFVENNQPTDAIAYIYCFGGGQDWGLFDVRGVTLVMNFLVVYAKARSVMPDTFPKVGGEIAVLRQLPSGTVFRNVRSSRSATSSISWEMRIGDQAVIYMNDVISNWLPMSSGGKQGYMLLAPGVVFEELAPVEEEGEHIFNNVLGNLEQLNQYSAHLNASVAQLREYLLSRL